MPQHLLVGFGLLDLEVRGRRFVQKVYSDDPCLRRDDLPHGCAARVEALAVLRLSWRLGELPEVVRQPEQRVELSVHLALRRVRAGPLRGERRPLDLLRALALARSLRGAPAPALLLGRLPSVLQPSASG